jgi:hypothetical protein
MTLKINNRFCYVVLDGNFVLKKSFKNLFDRQSVDSSQLKPSAYTFNMAFLGEGDIINEEKYFF